VVVQAKAKAKAAEITVIKMVVATKTRIKIQVGTNKTTKTPQHLRQPMRRCPTLTTKKSLFRAHALKNSL
jgi:hypothetical protein